MKMLSGLEVGWGPATARLVDNQQFRLGLHLKPPDGGGAGGQAGEAGRTAVGVAAVADPTTGRGRPLNLWLTSARAALGATLGSAATRRAAASLLKAGTLAWYVGWW